MLRVDVVTIFPRMVEAPLADGIVRRAVDAGHRVSIAVHDLRDFTDDRHRTVDDAPFGGGPGMVMKAEPFFRAVESLLPAGPGPARRRRAALAARPPLRPGGRPPATPPSIASCCSAAATRESTSASREGVATEEVSLGDFVLTGGEVAALAVTEATVRLLPGALGDEGSALADSFADGILDCPHYTRPAVVRGRAVPEELLSGDHEKIARWRRKEALRATRRSAPRPRFASPPLRRRREALAGDRRRGEQHRNPKPY